MNAADSLQNWRLSCRSNTAIAKTGVVVAGYG
jgi:hypothetical protein